MRFVAVACALVSSALVSLALCPAWGEAQDFTFNPTRQWQARADVGHSDRGSNGGTGFLLGAGVNVPAGYYVRVGVDGAVGVRQRDGTTTSSARADFTARFLLDPFAEQRVGWYAGGGLTAVHDGAEWQPFVMLVVGREGPTTGRWRSAVEGSIGDGLRLSVVLRRARVNGR